MVLRQLVRVARQEVGRVLQPVADPRVLGLLILVALAIGALGPYAVQTGTQPEAGLFVVEINRDSPLYPALAADAHFELVAPGAAKRTPDLVISGTTISYQDADLSLAAVESVERAVRAYLEGAMRQEANQTAAFPIRVDLYYKSRAYTPLTTAPPAPPAPPATPDPSEAPAEPVPSEQLASGTTATTDISPNQVEPPFPMRSLLLTFAYLIPLNFLSQALAGSLHQERVRGRGLPLLSAPVPGWAIVAGRALPYLLVALATAGVVTVLIGATALAFAASLSIVAFALASAILLGVTTRGPRELTASLVATNVMFSSFLFLPAIFVQIHPIAFLSPVAVISATIRSEPVEFASLVYATLPLSVVATVLALVAGALYREESLFAPASPLSRVVDGVGRLARGSPGLLVAGALAVPFALALQAFLLIFAISLDLRAAFVAFLLGSAAIEEALKGLIAYAALTRRPRKTADQSVGKPTTSVRATLAIAALIGAGFTLGEKGVLLWSLIGLDLLPLGRDALVTFGVSGNPLLVFAPLILHIVAVFVTALFARADAWRGGRRVAVGWLAATVLHATYNGTIFVLALGGVV